MNALSLFPELEGLIQESAFLMESMVNCRTFTSPESVEEAWLLRKRFRTKILELDKAYSKKIAELRSLKDLLEIADKHQSDDQAELEQLKFELLRNRKDGKFHPDRS